MIRIGTNNTVAMTLHDLMLEKRNADQKLKKLQYFDGENHGNGQKTNDDQIEVLEEEIEKRKQEYSNLEKKMIDLTHRAEKLEAEKEVLRQRLYENDSRQDSLKKMVEHYTKKTLEEVKEYDEIHTKKIQKCKDEFEEKISETDHDFMGEIAKIYEVEKRLHQEIKTLKSENEAMKNESEMCKEFHREYYQENNFCQSYIGQVCSTLQIIMYHIVLPDHFDEDVFYRVKDIEQDIDDEDLLNDEEREKASERWKELKKHLCWDPSLEKTLKLLQNEGNPSMVRPESLTVEEAERVVEELNKQDRLRGRTSHERVKQIIEMWKTSTTLIQPLQ